MKLVLKITLLFLLFLQNIHSFSQSNTSKYIQEAHIVSTSWLNDMNEGKVGKCYKNLSNEVRILYDSISWCAYAIQINKEFGEKKKRLLTNAEFHSSLQGMEDGFYVTVSYDAKFKNTLLFKETVILKQDDQAKWRILDYSYEYQLKQDDDPTIKEK